VKPKAVLAYCREKGIKAIDLRFADVLGSWRHITFPVSALTEASFEEGFGHEVALDPSNHLPPYFAILVPQGTAHYLDPFTNQPTLVLLASIQDAVLREDSPLDARHVAVQAMRYLEASTIGDGLAIRTSYQFRMDRLERTRRTGTESELTGNTLLACGTDDIDFGIRCEVADVAAEAGLSIERHFSGADSSSEMILKPSSVVECCDDLLMLRYLLGQNASRNQQLLSAKNLWLPSQWSITRQGESIFVGSAYRGLSDVGLHAMGGILKHADSITAIALANVKSANDLPWLKLCSSDTALSICRVIIASNNPRDRAIEFRGAPAACNPYLVYSAVLMAMIDGIQNKAAPTSVLEKRFENSEDIAQYKIGHDESGAPSRRQLMDCLMSDSEFLQRGEVFSNELLDLICRQLS